MDIMRQVLVQTYIVRTSSRGKEVVSKREADDDGVPPGHLRLASPYDPDARWSAKGDDLFWLGYKVHLTETCDDAPPEAEAEAGARPNLITDVTTTLSTVPDVKATAPIQQQLADRSLRPAEHYLDSGYPSAELIETARSQGTVMVTPATPATDGTRCDNANETPSSSSSPGRTARHAPSAPSAPRPGAATACSPSTPSTCTPPSPPPAPNRRPRPGRTSTPCGPEWKEPSTRLDITGNRRARYRGLPKVRLQHAFSATAINIIRLDAHWTARPLDRNRTSNLTRLSYRLAT